MGQKETEIRPDPLSETLAQSDTIRTRRENHYSQSTRSDHNITWIAYSQYSTIACHQPILIDVDVQLRDDLRMDRSFVQDTQQAITNTLIDGRSSMEME